MIRYPHLADCSTETFSGDDVVKGVVADPSHGDGPGRVSVEVEGLRDVLAFYGTGPEGSRADPVIFLRGDAVELRDTGLAANPFYLATSAHDVQALAEQFALSFGRPYLHLARPGILGSSGNHLDRRRPREVALVDAALSRLKQHFGWARLNLVGQSGGGHLVAALMARRTDIDCAVIASGNTAVAQRNRENGWSADITGHSDFLDPIDHVAGCGAPSADQGDRAHRSAGCPGFGQRADRLCRGAAGGGRRGRPPLPAGNRQDPPQSRSARGPGRLYLFDDALSP